ncbi:ATP-binding cassette domain-containing protein, partial [bacterium]|nr:ATP-binding cassette domain-containing protein [bacterium]
MNSETQVAPEPPAATATSGDVAIDVKNISKRYGATIAVNNVSFQARKGEIVGFLGPNGAGKSTTIKILTCYIVADGGQVTVAG